MKQNRYGRRIQNWHRPLPPWELKHGFLRAREQDPVFSAVGKLSAVPVGDLISEQSWDGADADFYIFRNDLDIGQYQDEVGSLDKLTHWLEQQIYGRSQMADLRDLQAVVRNSERSPADITAEGKEPVAKNRIRKQDVQSRLLLFLEELNEPRDFWALKQQIAANVDSFHAVRSVASEVGSADFAILACLFSPFWVRDPADWNPKVHSSLLEHLFCLYESPAFLKDYRLWVSVKAVAQFERHPGRISPLTWICWLILLGQGESLKRATSAFRFGVDPGLQRYLYKVPARISPRQALECARYLQMGGTNEEYRWLKSHSLSCPAFEQSQFSPRMRFELETTRWIMRQIDPLTRKEVVMIVNWARFEFMACHQKGRVFSWKGRSLGKVLEKAEIYAKENAVKLSGYVWPSKNWDWVLQDNAGQRWSVTELITEYELVVEGREMRHCVGGYVNYCVAERYAIFSLRLNGERRATLCVSPDYYSLIQAYGFCNRHLYQEERAVVELWLSHVVKN